MMWWSDQGSGWALAVMWIGMTAFWALVVWAIVAKWAPDRRHADSAWFGGSDETPTAGAERILAERFARGEIDADEYHRRLADLHPQHLSGTRS
ncbi:MAG: SHOCT domain-containing protein [Actinomycetota bacterium]|nr:SHOCT domain-containing protein [Actinomycetota bacterium]